MLGSCWLKAAALPTGRTNSALSLTSNIELKLDCCNDQSVPPDGGVRPSLSDERQLVVLVEGRRRRQRPFERGGAGTPRIVCGLFFTHECMGYTEEEDQRPNARHIRAERRNQIPAGKRVRII